MRAVTIVEMRRRREMKSRLSLKHEGQKKKISRASGDSSSSCL